MDRTEGAPVQGIAGVVIWTEDLERMATFYRDVLALPLHSSRPHFVAFDLNGMRLSVGRHSQVHGTARDLSRIMVNLAVDNIEHSYATLRSHNVEFIRPPEREHWGGWVATFRDPDGNLLQLLQQPRDHSAGI
jgi:catechol 2,3-dioxygenase-like lactoylglutathione lyase family enzyme